MLKFSLEAVDYQDIEMPENSKILSVQCQRNRICVWALCPESSTEMRKFSVVGTGNPMIEGDLKYVGTVQQFDGQLVWHIFEVLYP